MADAEQEQLAPPERGAELPDVDERRSPWRLWAPVILIFVAIVGYLVYTARPQVEQEVFLHQVVVRFDPTIPGDKERARDKIETVRKELQIPGRGFAAVAFEYDESISGDTPGEVGWVGRGVLPPELERVAFSLDVDEVSDVIEGKSTYRVIAISDRRGFGDDG